MAKVKITTYPNCYRLEVDREKSEAIPYGSMVEVKSNGKVYSALYDSDGKAEHATTFPVSVCMDAGAVVVQEAEDPEDYDGLELDGADGEDEEEEEDDDSEDDEDDDGDDDDGEEVAT